jgi:hypothetical protein
MMQSEVSSQVNMKKAKATIKSLPLEGDIEIRKPNATIMSLPLEVDFMIIEWLPLKDALNMAEALLIPERVAVQYFAFNEYDIVDILYSDIYDLQPSSYKFLLKNKRFQIQAYSHQKNVVAVKTKDLDFLKKCLEQVEPDLICALREAAWSGFTDAVKLLLSDYRVDPSARDNWALIDAAKEGHLDIVKLLLSDDRVDPSDQDNQALINASQNGHLDIVKLLLADARVDPSVWDNCALICASQEGHLEIVKLLESHPRFRA